MSSIKEEAELVVRAVLFCGGKLVGRTKLQKTVYILEKAGWDAGFKFQYYHYGPYCEELADAAKYAVSFEMITEEENSTSWGSTYSIYTVRPQHIIKYDTLQNNFKELAELACEANPIELELAATALYLFSEEKNPSPWAETRKRKPQKAENERLNSAKALYDSFCKVSTSLPTLPNN